jgi:hypothetical protein
LKLKDDFENKFSDGKSDLPNHEYIMPDGLAILNSC